MLGVRSIGSSARITGAAQCRNCWNRGGRRGFYWDGGAMCGARRAMSGEIRYLLVLTAGVVDFVESVPGTIFWHVAAIAHVILRFKTTIGGSRE